MDWVPAYGSMRILGGGVAPGQWSAAFLNPSQVRPFSAAQAEPGQYEAEDDNWFVERIVGTVSMYSQSGEVQPVLCRIQPLQGDLENDIPQLPWAVDEEDDEFVANFRFWWERRYVPSLEAGTAFGQAVAKTNALEVDHPYWTQLDIRPKQVFGRTENLWPCVVVHVPESQVLGFEGRVVWSVRMLLRAVR